MPCAVGPSRSPPGWGGPGSLTAEFGPWGAGYASSGDDEPGAGSPSASAARDRMPGVSPTGGARSAHRPRRVVVTGGAGFLGGWLCRRLLREGCEVVAVDNLVTGSPSVVEELESDPGFTFVQADVTHVLDVPGPVDQVMHLASPASPVHYAALPVETMLVGSLGTMHALDLAQTNGARFVLASTSEVYGDPLVHPQPESYWGNVNPVGPRGVDDEAKRYAEALTMAYLRQQGVDTAIVRIFNTFGPRMRPNDGRAIPAFLGQALADRPVTVFGDGAQTRSFCYVDDLVRGLVLLAESEVHEPVNIGNPNEMTLIDMAKTVVEMTESRSEIVFEALPGDHPQVRQPDIPRARDLLGWEPKVDLREGLAKTIEHASANLTRL